MLFPACTSNKYIPFTKLPPVFFLLNRSSLFFFCQGFPVFFLPHKQFFNERKDYKIKISQHVFLKIPRLFVLGPEPGSEGLILGHTHLKILAQYLGGRGVIMLHGLWTMVVMNGSAVEREALIDGHAVRAKVARSIS